MNINFFKKIKYTFSEFTKNNGLSVKLISGFCVFTIVTALFFIRRTPTTFCCASNHTNNLPSFTTNLNEFLNELSEPVKLKIALSLGSILLVMILYSLSEKTPLKMNVKQTNTVFESPVESANSIYGSILEGLTLFPGSFVNLPIVLKILFANSCAILLYYSSILISAALKTLSQTAFFVSFVGKLKSMLKSIFEGIKLIIYKLSEPFRNWNERRKAINLSRSKVKELEDRTTELKTYLETLGKTKKAFPKEVVPHDYTNYCVQVDNAIKTVENRIGKATKEVNDFKNANTSEKDIIALEAQEWAIKDQIAGANADIKESWEILSKFLNLLVVERYPTDSENAREYPEYYSENLRTLDIIGGFLTEHNRTLLNDKLREAKERADEEAAEKAAEKARAEGLSQPAVSTPASTPASVEQRSSSKNSRESKRSSGK